MRRGAFGLKPSAFIPISGAVPLLAGRNAQLAIRRPPHHNLARLQHPTGKFQQAGTKDNSGMNGRGKVWLVAAPTFHLMRRGPIVARVNDGPFDFIADAPDHNRINAVNHASRNHLIVEQFDSHYVSPITEFLQRGFGGFGHTKEPNPC